jgi:hypothetical protein
MFRLAATAFAAGSRTAAFRSREAGSDGEGRERGNSDDYSNDLFHGNSP